MIPIHRRLDAAISLGFALALAGCGSPIKTVAVGPDRTYESLNANAINQQKLSADTLLILSRFGLETEHEEDPLAAIRHLHAIALAQPARDVFFSLAELCYALATTEDRRDCYLGAAVYAYSYLFGSEAPEPANPFDRRFRVACDLYNYGLLKALRTEDGDRFPMEGGHFELPVGSLDVHVTRPGFPWDASLIDEFVPADNFRIVGFSSRRRDAGIGVPLIATRNRETAAEAVAEHMPPRLNLAATAFLRVEGGLADLERGVPAALELYAAFNVPTVDVGGHPVPLETDLTAPLARQLETGRVWAFEFGSFLSGSSYKDLTGMWMLQPYQRGKIPVVFVHGTASSPARWAEMFNQLNADAVLRAKYQFWFFSYTTGNPIIYSGSLLREALTDMVKSLDPEGTDASLRDMVVIGHSQGGILTKLQAVASGDAYWHNFENSGVPIEKLTAEDIEFLKKLAIFEPHPSVKRVIFVSTPQHGALVATGLLGAIFRSFASAPSAVFSRMSSVVKSPDLIDVLAKKTPTSVENMAPDNQFVTTLVSLQIASGIHAHSIIAVQGEGPPDELDDGAVAYKSAHIEPVDSEFIVRAGHSCQDNPFVIEEVHRILLLHLQETPPASAPSPAPSSAPR
jgi:pimeloyl-ACP methyl ester carboxylesterase